MTENLSKILGTTSGDCEGDGLCPPDIGWAPSLLHLLTALPDPICLLDYQVPGPFFWAPIPAAPRAEQAEVPWGPAPE